jgi:Tfp pilus assembly protein PilX
MMTKTDRSDERGIAMIIALFMVLVMSVLGTSLMFVSQTETVSSMNYRLMSQARYGAESGVHMAANYLLSPAYAAVAPGTAADPLAGYTTTATPVTLNGGGPVVLSSYPGAAQTYANNAVKDAFANAAKGTLNVQDATVNYYASARLLSMRQIDDKFTLTTKTLQTWEITATGKILGAQPAEVEVSAVIEVQPMSLYSYAAFATANGCAALSFAGGAITNSYDSSELNPANPVPVFGAYGGNVGTNGNLTEVGNPTTINGSMSTPRSGVGACSANNVTAETIVGNATVSEGLTQLSQEIQFPTPSIPDLTLNPTPTQQFTQAGGCPSGVPFCVAVDLPGDKGARITPPTPTTQIELGDVVINGSATVHLNAGTYLVNSIDIAGSSQIKIDSGPVIFKVKGDNVTTPIKIEGNGISNPTLVPSNLEFQYAGTGTIQIAGGTDTAALFYAPNASGSIAGGADLYGSIVVHVMTATGGAAIHYDRNLEKEALTAGNPMMSAFTWKNYPD